MPRMKHQQRTCANTIWYTCSSRPSPRPSCSRARPRSPVSRPVWRQGPIPWSQDQDQAIEDRDQDHQFQFQDWSRDKNHGLETTSLLYSAHPPWPFTVPNVPTHPSTASVPIIILLRYGTLPYSLKVLRLAYLYSE